MYKKIIFLSLLLSHFFSQAQRILTLTDARKLGMDHSTLLKTDAAKTAIAQLKTKQIWNAQIPTVSLSSAYSRLSDNITPFTIKFPNGTEQALNPQILNQFSNRLSIQQVVFSGWRAKNYFEANQYLEKAVALDADKNKAEVRFNIQSAVLNLAKLQKTQTILSENLKVLKGRQTDTKNFVAQGTALENDLLKVDLAISQLETAKIEIENAIATAQFALAIILGLPESEAITIDEKDLTSNESASDLNTYLKMAVANRSELAALEQRNMATTKQVEIARGAYYPVVTIGANAYLNNPNQRVFPQQDAFKGTWDAGIALQWNLTNLYSNKYNLQEAQVSQSQVQLQKTQLSEGIKTEVAANYYAYQTSIAKDALQGKFITQTTENQRVTKNKYNAQLSTLTDLLEADFMLFQAQENALSSKIDKQIAFYKLVKAVSK